MSTYCGTITTCGCEGIWHEGGSYFSASICFTYMMGGYFSACFCALSSFYRFSSVTICQGATINSAVMTLVAGVTRSCCAPSSIMYATDQDNATVMASNSDAETRARTTANVQSDAVAVTSGCSYCSPCIKTVVQEVTDRCCWASCNALQIIAVHNVCDDNEMRQFNSVSCGGDPLIAVCYTVGGCCPTAFHERGYPQGVIRGSLRGNL